MTDFIPSVRSLKARFAPPAAPEAAPARSQAAASLRPKVDIPLRDPTDDDIAANALRERGRFLVRQDAWDALSEEIRAADRARALTCDLQPKAALLAEGARADVLRAARKAIARGEPRAVRGVVAALEVNLEDAPDCPALAAVVALAHLDLARTWRSHAALRDLPPQRRAVVDRHLQTASVLADTFDPFAHDSALWARVRCGLLIGDPAPAQRVADDYEDLLDLDPGCPGHMLQFGRDLLPRRFGTYEALDVQARRTVERLRDVWGAAGYTWVFMGALEQDFGALRRLDAELFVEGLHDILERHPTQAMANRLAAFCGLTMSGAAARGSAQKRLQDAFGWIAEDHLCELHPRLWARAGRPGRSGSVEMEDSDMVRRGTARALSALAEHFSRRIDGGESVIYGPEGLRFERRG